MAKSHTPKPCELIRNTKQDQPSNQSPKEKWEVNELANLIILCRVMIKHSWIFRDWIIERAVERIMMMPFEQFVEKFQEAKPGPKSQQIKRECFQLFHNGKRTEDAIQSAISRLLGFTMTEKVDGRYQLLAYVDASDVKITPLVQQKETILGVRCASLRERNLRGVERQRVQIAGEHMINYMRQAFKRLDFPHNTAREGHLFHAWSHVSGFLQLPDSKQEEVMSRIMGHNQICFNPNLEK